MQKDACLTEFCICNDCSHVNSGVQINEIQNKIEKGFFFTFFVGQWYHEYITYMGNIFQNITLLNNF